MEGELTYSSGWIFGAYVCVQVHCDFNLWLHKSQETDQIVKQETTGYLSNKQSELNTLLSSNNNFEFNRMTFARKSWVTVLVSGKSYKKVKGKTKN